MLPAAFGGGVFFALAGINHLLQRQRNRLETMAMLTDLFAAVVLFGGCVAVGLPVERDWRRTYPRGSEEFTRATDHPAAGMDLVQADRSALLLPCPVRPPFLDGAIRLRG